MSGIFIGEYQLTYMRSPIDHGIRSQETLEKMKNEKVPVIDNLRSDVVILQGDESVTEIRKKCLLIFRKQKKIPAEWKEARITVLHRKREMRDTENHRPFSLLSLMCKLFTRRLQIRMEKIPDENQPREQASFRKGYLTVDHLQTIDQLIRKKVMNSAYTFASDMLTLK